jgi:excisionase family DNA binding protein
MNVITIEHEAFQQINDRLAAIESGLNRTVEQHFEKTWMDGRKVAEMLDISRSTLQIYRDQGKIGFSQVGRKVYYRASDVLAFLEKHHKPAFRIRR